MTGVKRFVTLCLLLTLSACTDSPQQADPDFWPRNTIKTYSDSEGPVVAIDEAHYNFSTASGRYKPFAQVLQSAGYQVEASKTEFSLEELRKLDVLVIVNAMDGNRRDWQPPFGNALKPQEVNALLQWVNEGGALLLIADHTPFPKFIDNLTLALQLEFSHGHVANSVFNNRAKTLVEYPVTRDLSSVGTSVFMPTLEPKQNRGFKQVRSFGGSAFKPPKEAISLLNLAPGTRSLEPVVPFQITAATPRVSVAGWSQGALIKQGKGRVAVFAEAAMFTAQVDFKSGKKFGMSSVGAEQNERFLLNVMHWLAKTI